MTVDMSISLELVETFSLSPLERAVTLNLWQNMTFVLDRAFLRSVPTTLWKYSVFGVFLTGALAARCTDCARIHVDQTCSRAQSHSMSVTFSVTFSICGSGTMAHGFAYHRPAVSSILRAVELATVHVSTSHLQGAGWSPAPLLTSARDY